MDPVFQTILSGGVAGAFVTWLFRSWITERLKQSISHEYDQKLENHKAELTNKLQLIEHQNQLQQLRTSLFFDHQRDAFCSITSKIADVKQRWIETGYEEDIGLTGAVPSRAYKDLKNLYLQHQIFLDDIGVAAMELMFKVFRESLPFDDGQGSIQHRDPNPSFDAVEYIQPRITEIFRAAIGAETNMPAVRELAIYGSMKIINGYHFKDIDLPPSGNLKISPRDCPGDIVAKGNAHLLELTAKIHDFRDYLRKDGGVFHEAASQLTRYINMIDSL